MNAEISENSELGYRDLAVVFIPVTRTGRFYTRYSWSEEAEGSVSVHKVYIFLIPI